jgi:hypothetical protein
MVLNEQVDNFRIEKLNVRRSFGASRI